MIAIFPEIAGCAANGDIEQLICLIRQYFGDRQTFAPRLDVKPLMETMGITVDRLPLDSKGALLAKDEKGRFQIAAVVPSDLPGVREERFLLAHLLGHFILHVQPLIARGDLSNLGFKESVSPLARYEHERSASRLSEAEIKKEIEADEFAAALLLPSAMLKRAIEKLGDNEKVATFFDVSVAFLARRIKSLDLGEEPSFEPLPASSVRGGMDRIRQLAKMLDRSVE